MKNSMRVKIKNDFLNPLDNRMAKVDSEMNVPKSQFWFKRIKLGDCVEIQIKKSKEINKSQNKNNQKGSK